MDPAIIYFVTSNINKMRESSEILAPKIQLISHPLALFEIQATEGEAIVASKLKQAYQIVSKPLICEDTSLYIDVLNGFPGPYVKDFCGKVGIAQVAEWCHGSLATAETIYGYYDGVSSYYTKGSVQGKIVAPLGNNGFGWDSIFIPNSSEITYAQMSTPVKQQHSPRNRALMLLRKWLYAEMK